MSDKKVEWEQEALKILDVVPSFIRPMVIGKVEKAAQEAGLTMITAEFVEAAKARWMGG